MVVAITNDHFELKTKKAKTMEMMLRLKRSF
jgi:hypothetical protein